MTDRSEALDSYLELAQQGDNECFGELVKMTYKENLSLALKLVGNLEDASDVLQEAYLRAFRSLRRFRGEASFQTWMYRIVSNCASTHLADLRKKLRERPLSETSDIDRSDVEEKDSLMHWVAVRFDIEAELKRLPSKLRSVVVLRDVYGFAHQEIAEKLGISEATAKVRLHRARKRLAQALSWLGSDEAGEADSTIDLPLEAFEWTQTAEMQKDQDSGEDTEGFACAV